MRVQILMKPKVLLLSLFAGVVLGLISVFLLLRLDYLVHNTLYEFGLQFRPEWAEQYWIYARPILGLLGLAVMVNSISAAYVQVCERRRIALKPWAVGTLLLIGTFAALVSMFFYAQLDLIINGDLYRYGLQFSYVWANQYWMYARLTLALTGLVAITNGGSIAYVLATPFTINSTPSKSITWLLLASGSISLFLSVIFESSIAAFIGLGLIFWGAIMLYVKPQRYIQERMLAATILPSLVDIDQIVMNLGYRGPALYLPPKYVKDIDSSKAYISAGETFQLPAPEQTQQQEGLFLKEPDGILLTPLGAMLTRLFEKILGKSFTQVDLQFLLLNMPRVIVEDLEIAQNIELSTKNEKVFVRIGGLVCEDMYMEAKRLPIIDKTMGHPITSAIACALAKATGKVIIMERETVSEDGEAINAEYRLLEEPSE